MSICPSGHLKCCSHPIWALSSTYSLGSLSSREEHWQMISTYNLITHSPHITGMICFMSFKGRGFLDRSGVKNPPASPGHMGSIPGLERCPGEGNGNPFHCPCLGNPMGRGVSGLYSMGLQSWMQLSDETTTIQMMASGCWMELPKGIICLTTSSGEGPVPWFLACFSQTLY